MFTPNKYTAIALVVFNFAVGVPAFFYLSANQLVATAVVYFLLATLFNIGLHRYFAHTAYKVSKPWQNFFAATSFLTMAGSPISFVTAHLPHHKHTDNNFDPVGRSIGFWRSFFFLFNLNKENIIRTPKRLVDDPVCRFVHRYYFLLFCIFYLSIFLINPVYCLIYSSAAVALFGMYAMTNYTSHETGFLNYRNFNTKDNSQNNILHGLIGAEWHNNHHKYPGAWNQKVKWWEIDTSSYFIRLIKID